MRSFLRSTYFANAYTMDSNTDNTLRRIFEANLAQLLDLTPNLSGSEKEYCEILIEYLRGDIDSLEARVSRLSLIRKCTLNDISCIYELARIRFLIRKKSISEKNLDQLKAHLNVNSLKVWSGEIHFVLGLAYEHIKDENKAIEHYQESSSELEKIAALKKSVKAGFNAIAAQSRLSNNRNRKFLIEYNQFLRKAKKVGCFSVVGMAYNNTSNEYQKLGALHSALKYSVLALGYLRKYDFGSLDYYTALAQHSHVLIELGRQNEVRLCLEEIRICDFKEIKTIYQLLVYFNDGIQPMQQNQFNELPQFWQEKLNYKNNQNICDSSTEVMALSEHENRVLEFLKDRGRDKYELISFMYGDLIGQESAENRLKNLLNRIRKKRPGLIYYRNTKYWLSDSPTGFAKQEKYLKASS